MTDDELLREASDPTTPGERLRALCGSSLDVEYAVLRNPNAPLDLLRRELQSWGLHPGMEVSWDRGKMAWHNPTVPLLLLQEPTPEYRQGARVLLTQLTHHADAERRFLLVHPTLEAHVAAWAALSLSQLDACQNAARAHDCHALARHLASLFGLPWPASPAGPSSPTDE